MRRNKTIGARRWIVISEHSFIGRNVHYLVFNENLEELKDNLLESFREFFSIPNQDEIDFKLYEKFKSEIELLKTSKELLLKFDEVFNFYEKEFNIINSPVHWCSFLQLDYKPRHGSPDEFWASYEFFLEDYFLDCGDSDDDLGFSVNNIWEIYDDYYKKIYFEAKDIYDRAKVCSEFVDEEYRSPFNVGEKMR